MYIHSLPGTGDNGYRYHYFVLLIIGSVAPTPEEFAANKIASSEASSADSTTVSLLAFFFYILAGEIN